MKIREILDLMEAIENQQDSTAEKGLDALEDVLANTIQILKSLPDPNSLRQNKSAPSQIQAPIDEGKISSGLVSLAIAGLSALGAGGAQANASQQDVAMGMAACSGFLVQTGIIYERGAKQTNNQKMVEYSKVIQSAGNRLVKISAPYLSKEEFAFASNHGIKDASNLSGSTKKQMETLQGCLDLVAKNSHIR